MVKVADVMVRAFPRKNDFLARYGGDEFAAILRDTKMDDARALADRFVRAVRAAEVEHAGKRIGVTVSVGVAAVSELGMRQPLDLIAATDEALYEAKRGGRNRVVSAPDRLAANR